MSQLIALIFNDPFKGEEALAAVHRMAGEGLLALEDTILIKNSKDGHFSVIQEDQVVSKSQKTGHLLGLVAAAVSGTMPIILGGTLAGRLVGKVMDHGITHRFVKHLKAEVEPGTSALVMLGQSDPERREEVIARLQEFGPKTLESDLPPDVQHEIENEIERQSAA
jgi:uncharacterized membrane protein